MLRPIRPGERLAADFRVVREIRAKAKQEWAVLSCGHESPTDTKTLPGDRMKCLVCVNLSKTAKPKGIPVVERERKAPKELREEMRTVLHPVYRDAEERLLALFRIMSIPYRVLRPNCIFLETMKAVVVIKGDLYYGRFRLKMRKWPKQDREFVTGNRKALLNARNAWRKRGIKVCEIWASEIKWPKMVYTVGLWRLGR